MSYEEFMEWFQKNLPDGADEDDFLEFLGMFGATTLQHASNNSGKSIDDLIKFMFTKGGSLSQWLS